MDAIVKELCVGLIGIMANYRGVFRRVAFIYLSTDSAHDTQIVTHSSSVRLGDEPSIANELRKVNLYLKEMGQKPLKAGDALTVGRLLEVLKVVDPACEFTAHCVACPTKEDPSAEFRALTLEAYAYVWPDFAL